MQDEVATNITLNKLDAIMDDCILHHDAPIKRHNDYNHFIHKICFLVDMGLDKSHMKVARIAEIIMSGQNSSGVLISNVEIAKAFRGPGIPEPGWIMCDFPLLLYFLIKAGYKKDVRVQKAIKFLMDNADDNGWRCHGYIEKFNGPGRKKDHCPLATLYALKVFSLLPEYHNEPYIRAGIDSLLYQWSHSYDGRIYMFGMGKRFRKLKFPHHWFDVLHVADVISHFKYSLDKADFIEMLELIVSKRQPEGGYVPESIYNIYKGWDFGQKKHISETLTSVIKDIIHRVN